MSLPGTTGRRVESPAQTTARSALPRCASSAPVAARATASAASSVAAEVSTTMARSSPSATAVAGPPSAIGTSTYGASVRDLCKAAARSSGGSVSVSTT